MEPICFAPELGHRHWCEGCNAWWAHAGLEREDCECGEDAGCPDHEALPDPRRGEA
jgi:hypothetical protein